MNNTNRTTEYGVRYVMIVGKAMNIVTKEKVFKTATARDKFAAKIEQHDHFYKFESWLN